MVQVRAAAKDYLDLDARVHRAGVPLGDALGAAVAVFGPATRCQDGWLRRIIAGCDSGREARVRFRNVAAGLGACCCSWLLLGVSFGAQQAADPDFDTSVARPAYPQDGPVVLIDEAHANFHTGSGRYRPFAELLRNDGYTVTAGGTAFDRQALEGVYVLVIANALPPDGPASGTPDLTDGESDAVRDWVRDGGSLLLIADHTPFGSAVEDLSLRFGVTMGKGWVWDYRESGDDITTQLVSSRENSLLGDHPLLRGRDASEEVTILRSFSGQSLGVPPGATALMRLSETAREAPSGPDLEAIGAAFAADASPPAFNDVVESRSEPVGGRAQGVALTFGEGRVVVLGEAAMLSAQVVNLINPARTIRAGMNVPGNDNRQFLLNMLHWLSGLLD